MTDFSKARAYMIDRQIRTGGVIDEAILESFASVPRELFVPEKLQEIAYLDETISLGQGRFLVAPLAHALLLQHAAPGEEDIVLDIGSASGYGAAILSPLVMTVIALERNKRQMDKASRVWGKLELCNIALIEENRLCAGHAQRAPYSLIYINASVPAVPRTILNQLAPGGRLACFIRGENAAMGHGALYYKSKNGAVSSRKLFDAAVPFMDDFAEAAAFRF